MEKLKHSVLRLLGATALLWLASPFPVQAQLRIQPGGLVQLQMPQPTVDVSSPPVATAEFDPPVVNPGGKTYYRVNIDATESAIQWPEDFSLPPELKVGTSARGMITQLQTDKFRPLTSFIYEVQAPAAGNFTVSNFTVNVLGSLVQVPAASLAVASTATAVPPPRKLIMQMTATNIYLGQPFRVRVILPAGPGNQIEALREIQFDGGGLMTDKTALQQFIGPVNLDGELKPAFVSEMMVTPIAAGPQKLMAQGFSAGREFTAPITIRGQVSLAGGQPKYVLLLSDPAKINVRPLPVEGELPGFTGAIGRFFSDPPKISTNRFHIGEPVQLKVVFHGEGDLNRFVGPAAPRSHNWQIVADPPPSTSFTLIPLTDEVHETPAIPFSYFDPESGKYVDLTVPPVPVTVMGEDLPVQLTDSSEEGKTTVSLKLSAPAMRPDHAMASLMPLQLKAWFVVLQLVPVAGFIALWEWDRRRRYLEAHPEIVRRIRARRALRQEKVQLQKAVAAGDATAFVRHAANAMNIAVAPHYPADPQALVGGDVLAQLDEPSRNGPPGELVKQVFAAADVRFAELAQPQPDLLALRSKVETVLQMLEARL